MRADNLTLTEFVASIDRLIEEEARSSTVRKLLYEGGQPAAVIEAFHPDRLKGEIRRMNAAIDSMTLDERSNPDRICDSRRTRIALGSGVSLDMVLELLSQFRQMSRLRQSLSARRSR